MQTYIVYRKELFLKAIIYILICALLGLASTYLLKSRVISIIILGFLVLPLPFMGMLLKAFTRRIVIQLEPAYINIEITNKDGEGRLQRRFELKQLSSYCIQFPNDKFNSIRFTLKEGKSFEYSFPKEKPDDANIDTDRLIDAIHQLISAYNDSAGETNKILLVPGFYATPGGLFVIVGLTVALFIAILLFSQNKTALPVTFVFSVILIAQLMIKRKRDLDYFKKMSA